jgi:hypothetical protein
MFATPLLLSFAARRGWRGILVGSGSLWLLAQFGLKAWSHDLLVRVTHLQVPLQETGAFNLFAWQLVWVLGLWFGASIAERKLSMPRLPRAMYLASLVVCVFFMGVRQEWFGLHLTPQTFGMQLDKWQIGPLRLLNLAAFAIFLYGSRRVVKRVICIEPFLTLGKASLEVFCSHLFFVFLGLAMLSGESSQLHGLRAVFLVVITFSGMLLVAIREVQRQDRIRSGRMASIRPGTAGS